MTYKKQRPITSQTSQPGGHKSPAGKPNSAVRPSISPPRKRIPRKPVLPRLSSYAEMLLDRKAEMENQKHTTELLAHRHSPPEWIGTAEASRLYGYSRRQIQNLCESGFFMEGEEWKQRVARPGGKQGGRILIRSAALKKLDGTAN